VGTNGEVILRAAEGFAATSCATGPALEGAAIQHGMQTASGAVDAVRFNLQTRCLDFTLIQRDAARPQLASGICGSGVISAVAELLPVGVIAKSGSFDAGFESPCLSRGPNGTPAFEIVAARTARGGAPIVLTQADVAHRIRLYHRTESRPASKARTAAAAEKRAVISVSRVSNTRLALRVS
jgi:uncharacterized 2Fe-2S/4Fe-4S cluster protein (DUF4445 family)